MMGFSKFMKMIVDEVNKAFKTNSYWLEEIPDELGDLHPNPDYKTEKIDIYTELWCINATDQDWFGLLGGSLGLKGVPNHISKSDRPLYDLISLLYKANH